MNPEKAPEPNSATTKDTSNNKPKPQKANFQNTVIIVMYSIFSAFLLVIFNSFPYLGISIFGLLTALLLFLFKKRKSLNDYLVLTLSLGVSSFIFIRANPLLTFFNIVALIYLNAINTLLRSGGAKVDFVQILLAPVFAVLNVATEPNTYRINTKDLVPNDKFDKVAKSSKLHQFLISLSISVGLLLVIIPILRAANPFFEDLTTRLFEFISQDQFWSFLFPEYWLSLLVTRVLLMGLFVLVVPFILSYVSSRGKKAKTKSGQTRSRFNLSVYLGLPKVVVLVVLGVFFITQIQLYTASDQTLKELSDNVNEVFLHLSVVAFIVFLMVYNDKSRKLAHKFTSFILILEGLFLTAMAFKSDWDYTSESGFTEQRLYGYAVVIWITGILLFLLLKYLSKMTYKRYVLMVVIFSASVIIGINITNFDRVIYFQDMFKEAADLEHEFLSKLSPDAGSYDEQFKAIDKQIKTQCGNEEGVEGDLVSASYRLFEKIESLQDWHKDLQWQGFSWSKYRQYQDIKDVNISEYREFLQECQLQNLNLLEVTELHSTDNQDVYYFEKPGLNEVNLSGDYHQIIDFYLPSTQENDSSNQIELLDPVDYYTQAVHNWKLNAKFMRIDVVSLEGDYEASIDLRSYVNRIIKDSDLDKTHRGLSEKDSVYKTSLAVNGERYGLKFYFKSIQVLITEGGNELQFVEGRVLVSAQ